MFGALDGESGEHTAQTYGCVMSVLPRPGNAASAYCECGSYFQVLSSERIVVDPFKDAHGDDSDDEVRYEYPQNYVTPLANTMILSNHY